MASLVTFCLTARLRQKRGLISEPRGTDEPNLFQIPLTLSSTPCFTTLVPGDTANIGWLRGRWQLYRLLSGASGRDSPRGDNYTLRGKCFRWQTVSISNSSHCTSHSGNLRQPSWNNLTLTLLLFSVFPGLSYTIHTSTDWLVPLLVGSFFLSLSLITVSYNPLHPSHLIYSLFLPNIMSLVKSLVNSTPRLFHFTDDCAMDLLPGAPLPTSWLLH